MVTHNYYLDFLYEVRHSSFIYTKMLNHGYVREVMPAGNVVFYPSNNKNTNDYSIALTPGFEQTQLQIECDLAKNRILLIAEAANASGDYVILEDNTKYMPLFEVMHLDILTYCQRLIKTFVDVTGPAELMGITPHDYITKLAD